MGCWRPSYGHDPCVALLHTRLSALYGGRHRRTTAVVATTSAAAGALTGIVGIGLARTPVSHDGSARTTHVKTVKPRHHATTAPATPFAYTRPTRSHSPSPTPTATHTTIAPTPAATPTASSSPTAPASSPTSDPTADASPPPSGSPPA